ncbi:MAG: helix-turn-helix transcriptional regulator [Dysgonomonas sp.]|uniref:S24 family peptidase n=1 Tax=Dysgonomonas sp. TaxID=1891233 RepID=UPI003A872F57
MKSIQERIIEYIGIKGITPYKFSKDLGLSMGYLDKRGAIGTDKYLKIIEYYKDINPEWLLTGKGNMLKVDKISDSEKGDTIVSELHVNYKKSNSISLYDVSAAAGFGSFDEMISTEKVVGTYVIPDFKNADWMIYVKGSSMYPKYSSGDIIACRVLYESRFIQWNKVYVIATREQGILVKRIDQSDKEDCLLAVSDNPAYKPFYIPTDEILGIALVVGVIRME